MSSVAAINPVLANLLQNLSQIGSPLASSPQLVAALQKASPGDIAQLSDAAIQLQAVNGLFGTPDSSGADSNSSSDPGSLFASLAQAAPGSNAIDSSLAASSNNANTLLANLEQTLGGSISPTTTSAGGLTTSQVQALFANPINLLG
jgi:hypothetical protein